MSCSLCCYTEEDCPDCAECICDCRCYDSSEDVDLAYDPSPEEVAYMEEQHPAALLTVGPPEPAEVTPWDVTP